MIIISGPSTVGKNPFIYEACKRYNLKYITPYTTRLKRNDEIEDFDYFFITRNDFHSKIKNREIIEWDYCLDNYYGYSFDFPGTQRQITHGLSRMALRIKEKYPKDVTTVFLMPSDIDLIYYNLNQIYSGKTLCLRKSLVQEEMYHSVLFDKVFMCTGCINNLFENEEIKELLTTK